MLTKEEAEKALAGAPVETEDGREVTQLTKFRLFDGEEILAGMITGGIYVSQWNIGGSPRRSALSPSKKIKKEKRTVEYTLMVHVDGETAFIESSEVDTWGLRWRKTNQTMTKEIEVE